MCNSFGKNYTLPKLAHVWKYYLQTLYLINLNKNQRRKKNYFFFCESISKLDAIPSVWVQRIRYNNCEEKNRIQIEKVGEDTRKKERFNKKKCHFKAKGKTFLTIFSDSRNEF